MTKKQPSVEETAKEIIDKVKHFAGKGQYDEEPERREAYLDGVDTAMAMLYIDLVGTPKTKGFLQVERQKGEELVRESVKKVNDIATQNGYALAIKHFEERIQKGQPVFEAIDGMKSVHKKRQHITHPNNPK